MNKVFIMDETLKQIKFAFVLLLRIVNCIKYSKGADEPR
jgi:hypothetical protein